MQHMTISSWPFRDRRLYRFIVRRKGRRWRYNAISSSVLALGFVLSFSWPVVAVLLVLSVHGYLAFVVVPRWADEDIRAIAGESSPNLNGSAEH